MTVSDKAVAADHTALQTYLNHTLKRRSIRKLVSGPIADETIQHILEAGRWSPSAANTQPTRVVVVKERNAEFWDFIERTLQKKLQGEQLQRALSRLSGYRSGMFSLVFYEDTTVANNPAGSNARLPESFAAQALGMAQVNIWNAIAAAGLATSNQHINLQMEEELREFLGVPATWKSYSIFPVGYPGETPIEGTRRASEEVIFYEYGPAL